MAATPYMSLTLPIPTVTLGPAWAIELNAALELIDSHDHTPGKGRLITSAALNINADLDINQQDLRNARSLTLAEQLTPLAGPTDIRSIFAVGDDLFYRDGLGNTIQITAAGALNAGTVGGIGGDYITSSALVSYNSLSQTFYFHQATSPDFISAKIDSGDITLREAIANAEGVTLKSPSGLALSYDITMPTGTPGSTLPLLMASNGDLSTGQIVNAQLAANAVDTGNIVNLAVTGAKIADDTITVGKIAPAANVVTMAKETITTGAGTWNKPASMVGDFAIVKVCGGGGGGASGNVPNGGGGGAGAQPRVLALNLASISSLAYSIGTGGAGGTAGGGNGSAGNDTTFGDIISKGGEGGLSGTGAGGGTTDTITTYKSMVEAGVNAGNGGSTYVSPGTAGTSTGYAVGGAGGAAGTVGGGGGGGGGGASLGAGGIGGHGENVGGSEAGFAATGAGGGGGGGGGIGAGTSPAGGAGANGLIEIFYWVNVNP